MKVELGTILNLQKLLGRIFDTPIQVDLAFKLQETIDLINKDLENFNKIRNKILKELGTQDKEDSDKWTLEDNADKFNEELRKVLGITKEYNLEFIDMKFLKEKNIDVSLNEMKSLKELWKPKKEEKNKKVG